MASSTAGWENIFTRGLGDAEAEMIPLRVSSVNESIVDDLRAAAVDIPEIEALSGRFYLRTTAFDPASGQLQLGALLIGVPADETGFGQYKDDGTGNTIDLSTNTPSQPAYVYDSATGYNETIDVSSPLLIGKELAEKLDIKKDDVLQVFSSDGSVSWNLTKPVDYVYKNENRGREADSNALVMRLEELQQIVAYSTGSPQSINNIRINFADSVDTMDEGEAVLGELKVATDNLQGTADYPADFDSSYFFYSPSKLNILEFVKALSEGLMQLLQIFGALIVMAGVLLIVNIQLMSVEEREQQVGVLRAIGTQRPQVLTTTIIETIFLGFIGSFIGIIGGTIYGRILSISMAWAFDYSANEIPVLPPNMMEIALMSFLMGFALALFTSVAPAWRASRINIVEVIRGISPPQEEKFGRKGFYFGIGLIIFGALLLVMTGLEPWQGPDAWSDINDGEVLFFIILLPVVGTALCFSYFFSKRWALNIMALALMGWSYFQAYILTEWLTEAEGAGGVYWIFGMIIALTVGSSILIGVNLDYVALIMRKTLGILPGMKAIVLLSMEQMASKKGRSTMVFAIFSVILTMNIFLASWSYSFRYGADETVELEAGGVDMIIVADQEMPLSIPDASNPGANTTFADLIQEQFEGVDSVKGFSQSQSLTPLFYDKEDITGDIKYENGIYHRTIPINPNSFWSESFDFEGWKFQFDLSGTKIRQLETFSGMDLSNQGAREENEEAWRAIANNEISAETGNPLAIVRYMQLVMEEVLVTTGDSIWLLDQNNQPVEFTVATLHYGNVLSDWPLAFDTPDQGGIFISEQQALNLRGFEDGLTTESLFIVEAGANPVKSDANENLAADIEEWANGDPGSGSVAPGDQGWFRQNYGIFGIAAIPAWEIFEIELEQMFRIMTFLQLFTSGGFLVGVLGLLVVAMRSVQERKREIGMMRSLGFRKMDVTFAVLMELILMGLIGLVVGLVNGAFMGYSLISLNSGMAFLIWWEAVAFYAVIILSSAFFAAIIPGWLASRIPPSDALRYSG
ncbi:MAG: ABC transporter permease [Candidatus Heimdallarchaeota archaeon]